MKRKALKYLGRSFFILLLSWLGMSLLAALFYQRLLYHPERGAGTLTPEAAGIGYEEVWLTAADGVCLHGWFVPGQGDPKSGKTLLVFHGNTGNLSTATHRLVGYAKTGLDAFMADYHGFGLSGDTPDEKNLYMDAEAAWRYLVGVRGVDPDNIAILGYSLGGAVAAKFAESHPEASVLILESTFTRLADVAADFFPFLPCELIVGGMYDTRDRLSSITLPLMVIHGR